MTPRRVVVAPALATVLALALAGAAHAQPLPRIEVFATSTMAIAPHPAARIFWLDGLRLLEAQLSQGLPADPARALDIARGRFAALGDTGRGRASNAAEGMQLAARYRIDRLPAIVFDGESIVYGTTDIDAALRAWLVSAGAGAGAGDARGRR